MTTMPLPFLMNRAAGLVSLALALSGLWFVAEWAHSEFRSLFWLTAGALLIAIAVFGRLLVLMGVPRGSDAEKEPVIGQTDSVTGSAGARLCVEAFGPTTGPVVVLTPGWGLDRRVWCGVVRQLARRWRVLIWDLPGVGESGRPFDGEYSLERLSEDLRAVLQLAPGRPVLLVGHSTGALITLELCRRHPELIGRRIAGLALLNGCELDPVNSAADRSLMKALREPLIEPFLRLSLWLSPLVQAGAWASHLNGLSHLILRATTFGESVSRCTLDNLSWVTARSAPSVQAKGARAMLEADLTGTVEGLEIPVLLMAGGCDLLVRADEVKAAAGTNPLARYILVPDVGHAGPLEQPEVYEEALERHAEMVFDRERRSRSNHAEVLARSRDIPGPPPEPISWRDTPPVDTEVEDKPKEPARSARMLSRPRA